MQLGDRGEVCESAQPTGECAGGSRACHTLHHRGGTLPAREVERTTCVRLKCIHFAYCYEENGQ
jgi:hypothetical protein